MEEWRDANTRFKLLDPTEMIWFRGITVCLEDLRSARDPCIQKEIFRLHEGEIGCEEVLEDGMICEFTGTPAVVGVHKYYCHGKCNPIKATVVTNECPGCREVFSSMKSAKEHAHRSWKQGRCPVFRGSRPYSFAIEKQHVSDITCKICKEHLETCLLYTSPSPRD